MIDNNNTLRREVYDDLIVYEGIHYSDDAVRGARDIFNKLKTESKIEGDFGGSRWIIFNEVKRDSIVFSFNEMAYENCGKKCINYSYKKAISALKCLAISYFGEFIASTIGIKIDSCKKFLETIGNDNCGLYSDEFIAVEDFLSFVGIPKEDTIFILYSVKNLGSKNANTRELSNIMNYMVINNEINRVFVNPTEEEFLKWFPIYFWVNVTFILPLRATETMLTPYDCITHNGEKTYISVRRTILKKGLKQVDYSIGKDYRKYTYEIRESIVTKNIELYMQLTLGHKRNCLFDYDEKRVKNGYFSLESFNKLLAEFINEHIVGNHFYDFAKFTAGLLEFEIVSAGDSRPLAMSNLYFQDIPADLCRQLAGHVKIDTSLGYIMNVKETIHASSVMRLIDKIKPEKIKTSIALPTGEGKCTSLKHIADNRNISDCPPGSYIDCFGCSYYRMGTDDVDQYIRNEEKKTEEAIKNVFSCIKEIQEMKGGDDIDHLFTMAQTYAARLSRGYDYKVKEDYRTWVEKRNLQKTTY